ncbi:hypothetical protein HYW87_03215 [Candidatus Roizmanbacteria bacterium]|nr:hypothetical protein [Candidatus Roizmanbacteria bacterium]
MLTIICGEDTVASRKYLQSLKQDFSKKNYSIKFMPSSLIGEIVKWQGQSMDLFTRKSIFFTELLRKKVNKKDVRTTSLLKEIHDSKDIELFDWEDESARNLPFSRVGSVKEFKLSANIFKLLDSFYPKNKVVFLELLAKVSQSQDEHFIFLMLQRHVRNLILAKENALPNTIQQWQVWKLKSQASHWSKINLIELYEAFMRVEMKEKTGKNPYSIKESLDILACHFV